MLAKSKIVQQRHLRPFTKTLATGLLISGTATFSIIVVGTGTIIGAVKGYRYGIRIRNNNMDRLDKLYQKSGNNVLFQAILSAVILLTPGLLGIVIGGLVGMIVTIIIIYLTYRLVNYNKTNIE